MSDFATSGPAAPPLRERLQQALVNARWYDQALCIGVIIFIAILGDSEPDWYYFVPSVAAFGACMAAAFFLSARLRFSFLIAASLFLTIYAISWAKYSIVAMKFHVYDIVFHALSWTQFLFWIATFTKAAALCGRDRTTAAHACRVIEDRRDDPRFDAKLIALEAMLMVIPDAIR